MDVKKWLEGDDGEQVPVAGLGDVFIRPITVSEMSGCKQRATAAAAALDVDEETAATLAMCAATVLDVDDRKPLFTAADLAGLPMARLTGLIEVVGRINGFDADLEDLAGKLPMTENA